MLTHMSSEFYMNSPLQNKISDELESLAELSETISLVRADALTFLGQRP